MQAAAGAAGANEALAGAFDALGKPQAHIFDLPVNERIFLASRVESMEDNVCHNNGLGGNDSIDLLAWWNRFHANSYSEFACHLLSWCYENDTDHKASDICGWLFGNLPVNDADGANDTFLRRRAGSAGRVGASASARRGDRAVEDRGRDGPELGSRSVEREASGFVPPEMTVHSSNASARAKMEAGLERIRRYAGRQGRLGNQ